MKLITHGSAKMQEINLEIHAHVYIYEVAPKEYILVDCGYSNNLIKYTDDAQLDFDLIKLIKPVNEFLADVEYNKITVLLTHFHPDHIGELNNLKNCVGVYCNLTAFNLYKEMDQESQKSYMFLANYFEETPHDFYNALNNPIKNTILNKYFENVYDVFGNMDVLAVNLPGHVNDQIGYYFPQTKLFYIGDSVFTIEDIIHGQLHPIMISVAKDISAANNTLEILVDIHKNEAIELIPTHFKK